MEVEQLSFFSLTAQPAVAICCMDGDRADAAPAESWMPSATWTMKSWPSALSPLS